MLPQRTVPSKLEVLGKSHPLRYHPLVSERKLSLGGLLGRDTHGNDNLVPLESLSEDTLQSSVPGRNFIEYGLTDKSDRDIYNLGEKHGPHLKEYPSIIRKYLQRSNALQTRNQDFELDSTLDKTDVLENFDFDSFFNNSTDPFDFSEITTDTKSENPLYGSNDRPRLTIQQHMRLRRQEQDEDVVAIDNELIVPGSIADIRSIPHTPNKNSVVGKRNDREDINVTTNSSNEFELGTNPESDPELALALRMAMEEEQARLDQDRKQHEQFGDISMESTFDLIKIKTSVHYTISEDRTGNQDDVCRKLLAIQNKRQDPLNSDFLRPFSTGNSRGGSPPQAPSLAQKSHGGDSHLRDRGSPFRFPPYPSKLQEDSHESSISDVRTPPKSRRQDAPQTLASEARGMESKSGLREFFVAGVGIDRQVIQSEITRYLGMDAVVRPGTHSDGRRGFHIRAYRNLTTAMIQNLREDSAKRMMERERNQERLRKIPSTQSYYHFQNQQHHRVTHDKGLIMLRNGMEGLTALSKTTSPDLRNLGYSSEIKQPAGNERNHGIVQ